MPDISNNFVHLHLHTTYSLLDGACQIVPLVRRARELGMPALAITDHGNLFGLKAFYDACLSTDKKKFGDLPTIKPILGCEAYITNDDHRLKNDRGHHLILLAKNLTGYHNLVKLISIAATEGFYYHPRIDKELLVKYHEGLICSCACIAGEVASLIDANRIEDAEKVIEWYKDLFGEDYYLEIMLHKVAPNDPQPYTKPGEEPIHVRQKHVLDVILQLGRKHGVKVIATNDVHFLNKDDAEAHDILLCLGSASNVSDEKRLRYTRQEWFKTFDEMVATLPENREEILNTLDVAEKVEQYELDSSPILPIFPIPKTEGFPYEEADYQKTWNEENLRPEFGDRFDKLAKQGIDKVVRIKFESDYLRYLTMIGAHERWPAGISQEVLDRIEFELDTIKKMGFPGYFLIVNDYIAAARRLGVSVGPGRGSAAGSVVAYCLKITNVDPMKYDLLFERFLNPDRISMPDIDVDFDDYGRGRVLEYVTQKYGVEHVAHIVTFGQMAPKSAIKDVCRAMEIPLSEANRLASYVPAAPKITFDKALEESKELKSEFDGKPVKVPGQKGPREPELAKKIVKALSLARTLDGTLRQPGVHACGVIISRDPLIETLPVMPTEDESLLTTQYDGHFVEPIGLLKMDFLGLKTLTVIKNCLAYIKEDYGIDIDIDSVPLDDKETYALFSCGETTGLFQFESDGMKKHLKELQPGRLEDLVAMNALYRPGPMQYIPQFINRKLGRERIVYDHPLMEKYLKTTYGICVYQEQVMLLSRLLGGFTPGQSDTLRKAMGKKQLETMAKLKVNFIKGCLDNPEFRIGKWTDEKEAAKLIDKIWSDWEAFASYAFNKSHAVCYAYLAYQTGYLKAHYPAEFMCAQITSEIGNFDKLPGLVAEASEMKLKVLLPSVNQSLTRFSPGDKSIRYGLGGIRGVGEIAGDAIVAERKANGPFKGFCDFCTRMASSAVNRRVLEALVMSGAFDEFGLARRRLCENCDSTLRRAASIRAEKENPQQNLFDVFNVSTGDELTDTSLPDYPEWTDFEKLRYEREHLGVYISGDPLAKVRSIVKDITTNELADAATYESQDVVEMRICGVVTAVVMKKTKKKEDMATVILENGDKRIEGVLFPRAYEFGGNATALVDGEAVVAAGEVSYRDGKASIRINEMYLLSMALATFSTGMYINVPYSDDQVAKLEAIQKLIVSKKTVPIEDSDGNITERVVPRFQGTTPLTLKVGTADGHEVSIEVANEFRISPSYEFVSEVESILGHGTVHCFRSKTMYAHYQPRHFE